MAARSLPHQPLEETNVLPFNKAADNNKGFILEKLLKHLPEGSTVLEVASGTGQHALHFSKAMPAINWQPTDLPHHLQGISARFELEGQPENLMSPRALDISALPWSTQSALFQQHFDALYACNCLHVISWDLVEAFFQGVDGTLKSGGHLFLYGPYKYEGAFTTQSNEQFDGWLKETYPGGGIRDFEAVNALAEAIGLTLVADHAMPANNQFLVWKRS
ncbi:DUF938 domain-containing protein [Pseudovibrio sp. SPO723]|uniref:DUF938 domain-containing protein n=1 Tax=Nesiotobacter zosterae TaxID=392721 RepID=UPI0029CAA9A6|nr:DUF938 domain-containing protein [Pseudovibrio sp. SPO723]